MSIQLVVNARLVGSGEYIFTLPMAPDLSNRPQLPAIPAIPAIPAQSGQRGPDKILPAGSSAIAPGMSFAIPL